jgi:ferredoxin
VTHVVTDNCLLCKFTDCVATCPVDCFHIGEDMLYIDPVECVDCTACVPACPVQAIKAEYDLDDESQKWLVINAERAALYPVVKTKQEPLPTAEVRKKVLGF